MTIEGDGKEYELLEKWAKDFDCKGYYSCEIGVRQGYGSKLIIDNVKNNYMHVGVDPYGELKYQHHDRTFTIGWPEYIRGSISAGYTDEMRDTMLKDMYEYRNQGKFTLANMTDTMFMCHPDWNEKTYAFVYLDGPHMTKDVITEAVWFANRSAPHTRIVIDDTDKMETSVVAHVLTYFDFKTIEMGDTKICLEKK
jgi:hypothetical protein